MGPLRSLLRWGATVAAVDLPRPELWTRLLADTHGPRRAAHRAGPGRATPSQPAGRHRPPARPARCHRVGHRPRRAPRARQLRLRRRRDERPGQHRRRRADRRRAGAAPRHRAVLPRDPHRRVRRAGRGGRGRDRVLRPPPHLEGAARAAADAVAAASAAPQLHPRRGPRHQRLRRPRSRARTTCWPSGSSDGGPPTARAAGATVSFKVAPPTRTRSVLKNRALAAAYSGAHRFGVEVFEPGTANTLMAALLVHDLVAGPARPGPPVAGRGVRRGTRWAVALGLRPPQRPRPGRPARRRLRPLTARPLANVCELAGSPRRVHTRPQWREDADARA